MHGGTGPRPAAVASFVNGPAPTDGIAAHAVGLAAIGLPSAGQGLEHAAEFCRRRRILNVVIVSDADDVGRRGAADAARVIRPFVPLVHIIEPPASHKDLRAWVNAGATADDIIIRTTDTRPYKRTVRIGLKGGGHVHQ